MGSDTIAKAVLMTFKDSEEHIIENVLSALSDKIQLEVVKPVSCPDLIFPGLEIRLDQRLVLRDGKAVSLTRYEYGILIYLAAYPGHVFSKRQIFEAVWREDSDSCFSVVANTISHLRGKIETDRKNPVYIKTVYDGYKFDMQKI